MKKKNLLALAVVSALSLSSSDRVRADDAAADSGTPQVFLDKNPRIVAYQLKRLSNAQLVALERKTDHPKYKPVYEAILVRKGMERKHRENSYASSTPATDGKRVFVSFLDGTLAPGDVFPTDEETRAADPDDPFAA